jgi:hypothetical protein
MKWLRILVLASAAALPFGASVVNASSVPARERPGSQLVVMYRMGPHRPWIAYGSYVYREHAEDAARRLRSQGCEAYIRARGR